MEARRSPYYDYKVVFIGPSGAGKSGLLCRLMKNNFEEPTITIGADHNIKAVKIDGQVLKLAVWDTAGVYRFRDVVSLFCRNALGVVVVYDVCSRDTFEEVEDWLNLSREHSDADAVIMLIGNKLDKEPHREVPTEEGRRYADQNNLLFMETSALDSTNVEAALAQLVTEIDRREKLKPVPSDANPSDQTGSSSGGNSCIIM